MRIRLATRADGAAVRAVYAPAIESSAISFELDVPSVEEMATRIHDRQPTYPWLVAESDGAVVGYAYGGRYAPRAAYEWSVETSVYVAEGAQRRGVGRALYTSLLAVLTEQGYRQALGGVALPNPASVALHECMGFELVGVYRATGWKLDAWHDVGWWQRSLGRGFDEPPSAPVPVDRLPAGVLDAALVTGPRAVADPGT